MLNLIRWTGRRVVLAPKRDSRSSVLFIFVCWLATTAAAIVVALGHPTGASNFSRALDIGKAIGLNSLALLVAAFILAVMFSVMYIPLPRFGLSSFIYTLLVSVGILYFEKTGLLFSVVAGGGYSLTVGLLGLVLIWIMRQGRRKLIVFAMTGAAALVGIVTILFNQLDDQPATLQVSGAYPDPISAANPGQPGGYDFTFLTYGSGEDLHREAFGEQVDEVVPTVDASHFITKWGVKRKEFWGFDPSHLPLNGRVWLPEGAGPFPVVLMVHGNHTMEDFSTAGYDYLGEQLTSKGFLAISVDEDFVNFSNVSGSPNDNYELRAWLLLKHLQQLQVMNQSPESVLHEKVDIEQVALIGHSRGGQAVAMAADYHSFVEDEDVLESMSAVNIRGVVALAPTDKSVDQQKPYLHNVSYLALQGARDADISDFRGDRQFYRTSFDPDVDGFKATLYIADANHAQFNTSWGRLDQSLPKGVFLNQRQTMAPHDQRQIAKVYVSAFMERVFNGETVYDKLFQDYRYGRDWLPDTMLVNKFQHASYRSILQFDDDDVETLHVRGLSKSDVTTPTDRKGKDQSRDALELEWEKDASLSFDLESEDLRTGLGESAEQLVLTMANIDDEAAGEQLSDVTIELETADGITVQLPLDAFMPLPPVVITDFTHFGLFDDMFREGKYERSWEPVYQTFELPLAAFEQQDSAFDQHHITKLTLQFKAAPGKILLQEIGVW